MRVTGRVLRFLAFPVVSSVLAVAVLMAVYFTPLYEATLRHDSLHQLLRLLLVAVGCLFCWPLLSEELLPDWCRYPLRTAFAFLDGLFDAIPAIVIMTGHRVLAADYYREVARSWGPSRHWDQTIGGGLMFTISEAVAVPFLIALFIRWIREDERNAVVVDRRLDESDDAALMRPWWEVAPGPLADRVAMRKPQKPG